MLRGMARVASCHEWHPRVAHEWQSASAPLYMRLLELPCTSTQGSILQVSGLHQTGTWWGMLRPGRRCCQALVAHATACTCLHHMGNFWPAPKPPERPICYSAGRLGSSQVGCCKSNLIQSYHIRNSLNMPDSGAAELRRRPRVDSCVLMAPCGPPQSLDCEHTPPLQRL